MKEPPKKKPKGRPPASKASLKTKPNISIANRLQWEAQEVASKLDMGYSEWVSRAIERQIARDAESDAVRKSNTKGLKRLPSPAGEVEAAAS
jgi:hypothetical protein